MPEKGKRNPKPPPLPKKLRRAGLKGLTDGKQTGRANNIQTIVNIGFGVETAKLKIYDWTLVAYDGTEEACDGKLFVVN